MFYKSNPAIKLYQLAIVVWGKNISLGILKVSDKAKITISSDIISNNGIFKLHPKEG